MARWNVALVTPKQELQLTEQDLASNIAKATPSVDSFCAELRKIQHNPLQLATISNAHGVLTAHIERCGTAAILITWLRNQVQDSQTRALRGGNISAITLIRLGECWTLMDVLKFRQDQKGAVFPVPDGLLSKIESLKTPSLVTFYTSADAWNDHSILTLASGLGLALESVRSEFGEELGASWTVLQTVFPGTFPTISPLNLAVLELEKAFLSDVVEIRTARDRSRVIHATKDINAAGDEVEEAVRKVLSRRFPKKYHIGHGHIIDSRWRTSPQMDVVISDALGAPILFEGRNGTEYFTYESVYAVGEIKSTYYKSETPIFAFSNRLSEIKAQLSRKLPSDQTNPLCGFMIFADKGDFNPADVGDFYRSRSPSELPLHVCLLNGGVIDRVVIANLDAESVSDPALAINQQWVFIQVDGENRTLATSFSHFYSRIMGYITRKKLMVPDLSTYLHDVFGGQSLLYAL